MQDHDRFGGVQADRRLNGLGHVPQLDGVRALAVGIVMCAHFGLQTIVPGGFGVTIFFFLSGYLITSLLRTEMKRTARISFTDFYLRRAFRILPPLYVTVLFLLVLANTGLIENDYSAGGVWLQILFLYNYMAFFGVGEGVPSPLWSLAVEEHFYLIFPVVYATCLVRKPQHVVASWCAVACVAALFLRLASATISSELTSLNNIMSHTRMDSILFGSVLAVWNNPVLDRGAWRPRARHITAAIAMLLLCFTIRDELFRQTVRYSLQGIALFILFSFLLHTKGWVRDLLASRLARMIGLLSYTIYLVHMGLIELARTMLPTWPATAIAAIAIALTLAYSTIMYVAVEQPSLKLRRLLENGRKRAGLRPA